MLPSLRSLAQRAMTKLFTLSPALVELVAEALPYRDGGPSGTDPVPAKTVPPPGVAEYLNLAQHPPNLYEPVRLFWMVKDNTTLAGVARSLGIPVKDGKPVPLATAIAELGLDTSHWLGRAHRKKAPVGAVDEQAGAMDPERVRVGNS